MGSLPRTTRRSTSSPPPLNGLSAPGEHCPRPNPRPRGTGPVSVPWKFPWLPPDSTVTQPPGGGSFPFGEAVSAGLTQERQESFEAGRPLAVALLLGEITGGGVGTISYVDGNRIYGFGHPFESLGPVELPIIEAKVLGEISNLSAPFKFATLNPNGKGRHNRRPIARDSGRPRGGTGAGPDQEQVHISVRERARADPPYAHRRSQLVHHAQYRHRCFFQPAVQPGRRRPRPQRQGYGKFLLCRYRLGPFPHPPVRGSGWKAVTP